MTVTRSARRTAQKGVETTASHAVRTPNTTWAKAKARAGREGIPINRVIIELLEGYIRGIYKLPRTKSVTEREYDVPASSSAPEVVPQV